MFATKSIHMINLEKIFLEFKALLSEEDFEGAAGKLNTLATTSNDPKELKLALVITKSFKEHPVIKESRAAVLTKLEVLSESKFKYQNMTKKHYYAPHRRWGKAISEVWTDENGAMWVGNGEYVTRVNFCPFTGDKAPAQMEVKSESNTTGEPFISYQDK